MLIGKLAGAAGVNIQTIRFYEREGLLRPPQRSHAGYRNYEAGDLEQVQFIRRCQELGFSLAEIKQLMELHGAVSSLPQPLRRRPAEIRAMLALGCDRLRTIDQKIRALRSIQRQLRGFLERLRSASLRECPGSSNPDGRKKPGNGAGRAASAATRAKSSRISS